MLYGCLAEQWPVENFSGSMVNNRRRHPRVADGVTTKNLLKWITLHTYHGTLIGVINGVDKNVSPPFLVGGFYPNACFSLQIDSEILRRGHIQLLKIYIIYINPGLVIRCKLMVLQVEYLEKFRVVIYSCGK